MPSSLYYFRPFAQPLILRRLAKVYRLIPLERDKQLPPKWELPAVLLADAARNDLARLEEVRPQAGSWRVVCLLDGNSRPPSKPDDRVFAVLPRKVPAIVWEKIIASAFENLRAQEESRKGRDELHRAASDLATLTNIGMALSTEHNTEALLDLILAKSREVTGCDAGSLYLVEEEAGGDKHLVFKLTQCDSRSAPFHHFTLPIDTHSIAGYAAATGRTLNIKNAYTVRKLPCRFNRDFDRNFGYLTKSLLVVPMKNQKDETIGVLQLINAKKHHDAKLTSPAVVRKEVIPFSKRSRELAASLASQAAVALENTLLYRDIQNLFEGFVKASVTAIESRDPTTFGHSERVAKLTVGLAEAVNRANTGPYKDIHFTPRDIQELRYASVLHDFGKVGVREEVLVKAKKLYPAQLELIRKRFLYIKKVSELEGTREKLDFLLRHGNQNYEECFRRIDAKCQEEIQNIEECWRNILRANEPAVLPEKTSEKLAEIATRTFRGPSGTREPFLTSDELRSLAIPRGSLDPEERMQIESHVIHSFKFLSQIPWTKDLKNIPRIARAHHEKLNGSGYPYHVTAKEIPFQSKMMAIADMFDALTAHDRPYKRAVPVERALEILRQEADAQLLDPTLFKLFVDAQVYRLTVNPKSAVTVIGARQ